ncbi:winged helix-turn-helix domain-containing protein [Pseudoduganella buxea]|nr:winged helix-turn-helix domain-containing protein [Pseudoduganella buxea]
MTPMTPARFRFAAFELQLGQRLLLREGRLLPVTSRAFDVLAVLAARAGELVSKEELLAAVWPGLVVEENNIQVQISQLRKLIGAASIATVSGRGYRLTLPCTGDNDAGAVPPAPASVPRQPALPLPPALYGRDEDLSDLDEMVRSRRLVSVLGTSGVGKTALAAAAARRALPRFTDGAAWVDVGTALAPADVVAAIAAALHLATDTPAADVVAHLAARRLLLVLDNADRVSAATAALAATLLAHAPRLHLLVTTQVRLNLLEESVYRLAALAVPTAGTPLAAARTFGALAMLEARVVALDHLFALDEDNIAAAIGLCRKLDGLPLALELAAARVPGLGLRTVLAHLNDGLGLLSGGSAGAAPRHRSLQAALEWSYALLAPEEQALYRELAALPPWFGPDQLGVGPNRALRRLDKLAALVDRSLVVFDGGRAEPYALTETGRLFASAKRRQAGSTDRRKKAGASAGFRYD